jgi:6-phosphogluconolactonase
MARKIPKMTIYPGPDDLVRAAAGLFADLASAAVEATDRFTVALAGGGTPRPVYELLAQPEFADRIPWDKVHIFFGDERCVPPTDELSNFRMARKALLDHVPLTPENIHRVEGEEDPAKAALAYEEDMRRVFGTGAPPAFDLIFLGLGDDGHTASLFPGLDGLRERKRWVVSQFVEEMGAWRVTFTPVVINAARNVVFLVTGAGKAEIVERVLSGPYVPDVLPAQLVQPDMGSSFWLVDEAAGVGVAGWASETVSQREIGSQLDKSGKFCQKKHK